MPGLIRPAMSIPASTSISFWQRQLLHAILRSGGAVQSIGLLLGAKLDLDHAVLLPFFVVLVRPRSRRCQAQTACASLGSMAP